MQEIFIYFIQSIAFAILFGNGSANAGNRAPASRNSLNTDGEPRTSFVYNITRLHELMLLYISGFC